MLITMHEDLGMQQTHHDQVCVIIPQWVYKTLESFQLPYSAAIDHQLLSQYMSHQDMVDYLLTLYSARSIFEKRYGLFDQEADGVTKCCETKSPRMALEFPFRLNEALQVLGQIDGSTHSAHNDMRYENPKDPQELFWGSFVGDDHEIEWSIQDLGYRSPDHENPQNLNHVIGIVAYRLVQVDSIDQRHFIHRKLQRELLSHCFNEGVSLETLARSGMMDRYIAHCS